MDRRATQKEIKAAFRAKSKLCHPDMVPEPARAKAEASFKQLSEAYSRLCGHGRGRVYASGPGYAGAYQAAAGFTAGHARPWTPGGGPPPTMSSGMIAGVIFAPLVMVALYLIKGQFFEDDIDDMAGTFLAPQAAARTKSVGLGLPLAAKLVAGRNGSNRSAGSGSSAEVAAPVEPHTHPV